MSLAATSPELVCDARVSDPRWSETLGDVDGLCGRALAAASAHMKAGGEVSVLFTDDAEMQALNQRWRGLDKPTDVLSFPADGPEIPGEPAHLGDIALGFGIAMRDAVSMDRPVAAHISHLLVHGFLHLLGYDHIESADAAVMEPLEAEILAGLGLPDPYASGPYRADPDGADV
ncbi:MAG: rRNA maturation RNase YbeY [Alphaproteobacteria bacterium]